MSARCLHAHPLVGVPAGAASPRAAVPYAVLGSIVCMPLRACAEVIEELSC